MFYCEECKDKRGWPESLSRSKGPCEICGEEAVCFDVRSCFLPLPQKKMTFPLLFPMGHGKTASIPIEHTPPRQYYSPAIQCLPELLYGDDSMYLLEEGEDEDDSDSKQR